MMNITFKNYFKFPLIFRENCLYILTNNGDLALTWLKDSNEIENAIDIVNKMNGYSNTHFDEKWSIKDNVFIYYGDTKMFLIRGWHMLTSPNSHNINPNDALKIQSDFGEYLINNLNK